MAKDSDMEFIVGDETDKTRPGRAAVGDNTFNAVGTYCTICKSEDGAHRSGCRKQN